MIPPFSKYLVAVTAVALMTAVASAQTLPPRPSLTTSPWNGDWVLSRSRNTDEIKQTAADGYRFNLAVDGHIRWEIPSLHEEVEGQTDGRPMVIRRPGATGLSLSVIRVNERVLTYRVSEGGRVEGEGRMTLVDQGKAWVDISQPFDRPDLAGAVVYVRPGAP
jgi:hypothetical protein